jgi:hypothetical protein
LPSLEFPIAAKTIQIFQSLIPVAPDPCGGATRLSSSGVPLPSPNQYRRRKYVEGFPHPTAQLVTPRHSDSHWAYAVKRSN